MEYAIVTCCQDNRVMCGSGYKDLASVFLHIKDRMDSHDRGSTPVRRFVVVRADGVNTSLDVHSALTTRDFLEFVQHVLRGTFR